MSLPTTGLGHPSVFLNEDLLLLESKWPVKSLICYLRSREPVSSLESRVAVGEHCGVLGGGHSLPATAGIQGPVGCCCRTVRPPWRPALLGTEQASVCGGRQEASEAGPRFRVPPTCLQTLLLLMLLNRLQPHLRYSRAAEPLLGGDTDVAKEQRG